MENDSRQPEPAESAAVLNEQLVAYLDGELDDESSRQIEERLTSDSTLREQLGQIERTWDALDELEQIEVDEDFAQTTIEMVAVAAEEERHLDDQQRPARLRRRWLLGIAGLMIACLAGFVATWGFASNTNDQLIKDFPVLARLDEYRLIDQIEFLRLLREKNVFPPQEAEKSEQKPLAVSLVVPVDAETARIESLKTAEERREYIQEMTANQKAQLQEKKEHFDRLSDAKRKQLHKLYQDLQASDNREELERVMKDYVEWALVALSASERAHLDRISDPEERIQQVIRYKWFAEWRRRHFHGMAGFPGSPMGSQQVWEDSPTPMSPKYLAAVDRYVLRHVDELASLLPTEEREAWKTRLEKARVKSEPGEHQLWTVLVAWYLAGPTQDLPIRAEDVAEFEKFVPQDSRKFYDRLSTEDKIRGFRERFRSVLLEHFVSGNPAVKNLVSTEELKEFRESLSQRFKDMLDRMPSEVQEKSLRFWYFLSKAPGRSFGDRSSRFSFGRSGGGRPPSGGDNRRGGGPGPNRGPEDYRNRRNDSPRGDGPWNGPDMRRPRGEGRPDRRPPSGFGPDQGPGTGPGGPPPVEEPGAGPGGPSLEKSD